MQRGDSPRGTALVDAWLGAAAALRGFPALRQTCCPPSPAERLCGDEALGSQGEPSLSLFPSTQGSSARGMPVPSLVPAWVRAGSISGRAGAQHPARPCPAPLPAPSDRERDGMESGAGIRPPCRSPFVPAQSVTRPTPVPGLACLEGHCRRCAAGGGPPARSPSRTPCAALLPLARRWGSQPGFPRRRESAGGRGLERGLRRGSPPPALAGTPAGAGAPQPAQGLGARLRPVQRESRAVREEAVHEGVCVAERRCPERGGVYMSVGSGVWKGCAWGVPACPRVLCAGCSVCAWLGGGCMHSVGSACVCAGVCA